MCWNANGQWVNIYTHTIIPGPGRLTRDVLAVSLEAKLHTKDSITVGQEFSLIFQSLGRARALSRLGERVCLLGQGFSTQIAWAQRLTGPSLGEFSASAEAGHCQLYDLWCRESHRSGHGRLNIGTSLGHRRTTSSLPSPMSARCPFSSTSCSLTDKEQPVNK